MAAHGEESGRMEEGSELRGIYAEAAQALYAIFMDAADGTRWTDRAQLPFAAMIGVNMLSRAAGDGDWVAALEKSVLDAVAGSSVYGTV